MTTRDQANDELIARVRQLYFEERWLVRDIARVLELSPLAVFRMIRAMADAPLADDPATHTHAWEPASDLGLARYRCACGRTGYRNRRRQIVPCKGGSDREGPNAWPTWGRAQRPPTLDDYDRACRKWRS
jgi:hypothetical protein